MNETGLHWDWDCRHLCRHRRHQEDMGLAVPITLAFFFPPLLPLEWSVMVDKVNKVVISIWPMFLNDFLTKTN